MQAIAAGVVASSALAQAEDTRYAQLQKEYEALAPRLEEMGFGEIGSFGMGNLGPITGLVSPLITLTSFNSNSPFDVISKMATRTKWYHHSWIFQLITFHLLNKLDTNALRRAGMTDLADSLDSLGEKSLAAGYKGLAALTALADGDFAKAQQYGNEANNMLPDSTSLGFLSDFGFGDSATADNIATKAAATIVSI